MQEHDAIEAIEAGNETNKQIAAYHGLDHRHVGKYLKRFAEDPQSNVERQREGHSFVYSVEESSAVPQQSSGNEDYPVVRDYDWDAYVPDPSDVAEYVPTNGEWEEINAQIDLREHTGKPARALIGGPTGCGKTTLAENIANDRGWCLFTIQVRYSMDEADLLGSPALTGGETRWQDGPLTKALLASQERPVVILIDEANRAPARSKSALFSALDHRAQVTLDERGGEVIKGDPLNIITIATINEGAGYQVERLDTAEQRRYGSRWNVDYLGVEHPDRETNLIVERTPANETLASMLVETANSVRERAKDPTSDVRTGVPTSALLSWAQAASAYHERDLDNTVIRAAKTEVIYAFFGERESERNEVETIIKSHLDGAPFDGDELSDWAGGAKERVVCNQCGWSASVDEADEAGALEWMECPECNHDVKRIGA